jgi:serine/threonine protein kinase
MGGGKNILFDKFDIIECLKKDAGACVYIAFHIYLGKKILLKTLDRTTIPDPAMMKRFQREAKTLARLDFDNIIKVLDFGISETFFYISFEYFPSRNLRQVIDENSLSVEQRQQIFRQIVSGVAFAHKHKIIHRDLKPENILVDESLQVKVADFGLALIEGEESLTVQTSIVGTPGYMSPEQIRGEELTQQSDLFSLGVVGYELFTGINPFLGKDAGATLHNILSTQNDLEKIGEISDPFSELFSRLLKKSKSDRLRAITEVLDLLGDELAPLDSTTTAVAVKSSRINRMVVALVMMAVVTVVVIFAAIFNRRNNGEQRSAEQGIVHTDSTSVDDAEKPIENHAPPESLSSALIKTETVTTETATTQLSADARLGRLFIQCSPWAHVFIDSIKMDTTPLEGPLELPEGEYNIRLEHPDFPAYMKKIRINAAKVLTVAVDLDTLLGYFSCNIYPWGDIYIDDEFQAQTPFSGALSVHPGKHALVVKNKNYKAVSSEFYIAKKDTFFYQLNFETAAAAQISKP